jgi:hypothetical protein
VPDWVDIYSSAGLVSLQTESGRFEMMTPRGFLADEGLARSLAIMGRVSARPANLRKMAWLMPRMAKAVPYLGYLLVAGEKPDKHHGDGGSLWPHPNPGVPGKTRCEGGTRHQPRVTLSLVTLAGVPGGYLHECAQADDGLPTPRSSRSGSPVSTR